MISTSSLRFKRIKNDDHFDRRIVSRLREIFTRGLGVLDLPPKESSIGVSRLETSEISAFTTGSGKISESVMVGYKFVYVLKKAELYSSNA
jgi:hypothetical protein